MLPAFRTYKYIKVCQLWNADMLPAVWALKRSHGVGLLIFAFRVYRRHGAIVARFRDVARSAVHVFPVTRFPFRQPLESGRNTLLPGLVPLCFRNPLDVFASMTLAEGFEGLRSPFVFS